MAFFANLLEQCEHVFSGCIFGHSPFVHGPILRTVSWNKWRVIQFEDVCGCVHDHWKSLTSFTSFSLVSLTISPKTFVSIRLLSICLSMLIFFTTQVQKENRCRVAENKKSATVCGHWPQLGSTWGWCYCSEVFFWIHWSLFLKCVLFLWYFQQLFANPRIMNPPTSWLVAVRLESSRTVGRGFSDVIAFVF